MSSVLEYPNRRESILWEHLENNHFQKDRQKHTSIFSYKKKVTEYGWTVLGVRQKYTWLGKQ